MTAQNPSALEGELDPATSRRNRLVIALLLVSAFVVILNETIMGVALPRLMVDLDVPATAAQWLTTAFLLTMAVVIPITGFLLQRLNTKPVFILAMSTFSIGTLISAVAPGFELLLVGRIVQAVGTAIMMPLLMTTVMTLVPAHSRGRVMGNISIVISVAPAIGPTISGIILNYLSWRWMFGLVLPIAIGALVLGAMRIQNVTTPRFAPLDVLSVIISAIGFGGLVYGLSSLGEGAHAPQPVPAWAVMAVGVLALAVFVWRQLMLQRSDRALLDLRAFKFRAFTVGLILLAVSMMALFGAIILLPLYMQQVMGMTTLQAGLLLLPGGLVMGLMSPVVGSLYDKHGPAMLVLPGAVLVSGVMWTLALMPQDANFVWLLCAHVILSFGLALMFTPLFSSSLGALPPPLYSHGSALIGTIQQVAGAAGTALFIALMSLEAARLIGEGLPQAVAIGSGIRTAFLWGAVISLLPIVASFFLRKPENAPHGVAAAH